MIGAARPAISPAAVRVYLETPARRYVQIAVLHATSRRSWSFGSQSRADVVVRRLKEEAARLGANGVLLGEIGYATGASIGTEAGTNYMGPRGTVDIGIGASILMPERYGSAIAIYVPP